MSETIINKIPSGGVQEQIDAVNAKLDKLIINPGDRVYFHVTTAGFVTNGTTGLLFTIPVSKIVSAANATIVAMPYIAIRQNSKYIFGTSNTMDKISNHTAKIEITNSGLSVLFSFSAADSTAMNNSAAGVDISTTIQFS